MKDDKLEKEFEEYFKGVNIPNDITADAKKSQKPRRNIMPKIVKYTSIAASIVLVFAVALTISLKADFNRLFDFGSSGNQAGTPDTSVSYYTDGDLIQSDKDAYSLSSLNSSLKFIENIAYAKNSSVESCKAAYMDGKLALVTAEVSIISGLTRDETTIFVEFTDENTVYSELAAYYKGSTRTYYGAEYYLTQTTAENGEPEFKLHILYKGVKYYFRVQSTDDKAYEKYLKIVTGK